MTDLHNIALSDSALTGRFMFVTQAAGVDMLSEFLLNPLLELMNDPKWRVRLEAVGRTAYVSKQLVCQGTCLVGLSGPS